MRDRKLSLLLIAVIAVCTISYASKADAQTREPNDTNKLHMRAKPAIVRIISGYVGKWTWRGRQWDTQSLSSGSGFIINPNGYIMTNAHVVSDIKEGDQYGQRTLLYQLAVQVLQALSQPVNDQTINQATQILANEAQLGDFKRINLVFLQSGSRYPYEIKAYGAPLGNAKDLAIGKDVSIIKIEIKNAPTLRLGNSDIVQVGDPVWVLGYPGAADSDALDEKSQLEPTTNDGKISAKKTSADGAPILQTNANTTHGNSGGPAINERGEVIGILTFRGNTVNGQEVQGFNFIVPINTGQEFVRQAGTDNSESLIDKKWVEGLNYYWKQEYSNAVQDFSAVLALYPDHTEAAKLISDSQEHIAKGEDQSGAVFGGIVLLVLGGGFLLLVGAGVLVLVLVMRKKKGGAMPAPGMQPQFAQPHSDFSQQGYGSPVPSPAQPMGIGAAPAPERTAPLGNQAKTQAFSPPAQATAKLICSIGPLQGQEFNIGQGIYIGRDGARSQIVVPDIQVSGQHLWVGPVNGRIVAQDKGSTNGTFINNQMGNRITEVELKDRDVLTLGGEGTVKFVFKA